MKPAPTPAQVRASRKAAGLTRAEAGAMVYHSRRAWQNWELGARDMDPAVLELFYIKTGQIHVTAFSPEDPPQ